MPTTWKMAVAVVIATGVVGGYALSSWQGQNKTTLIANETNGQIPVEIVRMLDAAKEGKWTELSLLIDQEAVFKESLDELNAAFAKDFPGMKTPDFSSFAAADASPENVGKRIRTMMELDGIRAETTMGTDQHGPYLLLRCQNNASSIRFSNSRGRLLISGFGNPPISVSPQATFQRRDAFPPKLTK